LINPYQELVKAENKAKHLFSEIEKRRLIKPGLTEQQVNNHIYNLAFELFGIEKYWHKRIVRSGKNTLFPYDENPPNLTIVDNDIVFIDFGPIFENWEADFGKTYVLGNDSLKTKLMRDVELAWHEGSTFYNKHKLEITGQDFFNYTLDLCNKYGWKFGNEHCGHLVGNFPHQKIMGEKLLNYIHPQNHQKMSNPDIVGNERYWIYEIHFIDEENQIGGFFEQLLPCL
jgi:Xaa-Pro aminopeptidase